MRTPFSCYGNTMQQIDHQPLDFLTAALPPELWTLPPELAAADRLLDDPTLLRPLLDKLDPERGRPSVPAAQILRLLYLKDCYQLSDRVLLQEVADSFHWRRFCHFGVADPLPHPTTLPYWRHRIGPEGIRALNAAVVARLRTDKVVRGRRFRPESTVIEANIHYPTDAGLIADGIRRVTRQARRLQQALGLTAGTIRDRTRSVKKHVLRIAKVLRHRTGEAGQTVRTITDALARLGEAQSRAATRLVQRAQDIVAAGTSGAARWVHQVAHAVTELRTVIDPSRRATAGERIPDRVVSLVDPDARPIKKGKLGKPIQFGYTIQIVEAEHGFVTDDTVERGHPPDTEALLSALDRHRTPCGRDPTLVATDRGYWSAANDRACRERGIRTGAIPKRGPKSAPRLAEERRPAFRRAQRWRAGGEATISRLKRQYGLRRSRYRGYAAVAMGVGLGIFAHNVRRWARQQVS